MIKRIFQCDSIPLTMLSLALSLGIYIGSLSLGSVNSCVNHMFSDSFPNLANGPLKYMLTTVLLIVIPIGYRRSIGRTGILDINERVSLYPISLVLLTVLSSCNSLLFLIAAGLMLILFSRVVSIKEGQPSAPVAFIGGVVIALCTWISPYFFFLVLFLWSAISTLSTMSWRTLIWSVLGLISPLYLYFTLSYIISGSLPEINFGGLIESEPDQLNNELRWWWILYLGFFVALFILMVIRSIRSASKGIVLRRKLIRLGIILFIITATISALIFQFESAEPYLGLMSIPMAIIFQEIFRSGRTPLYSVSFLLWVLLTITIAWT